MAKNKVYQWMDQLKGFCRVLPRDMTIKDTARMVVYCFWKTRNESQKPDLPTIKKPKEVTSSAKEVGLNAIRDLQLRGTLSSKKTPVEPKTAWPFDGFISKALFFRKMGTKQ